MSKEIFIVYATHLGSVEQVYAFESKENAEAKCFELSRKWVSEDSFDEYLSDNKITQISLETRSGKYKARIKNKFIGYYMTAIDAAKAYNQYIIDNDLPNQLNENI